MLSKNLQKNVRALSLKKIRDERLLFIAEGAKLVGDLMGFFECEMLFATEKCSLALDAYSVQHITDDEMRRISQLTTPTSVLAVFRQPQRTLDLQLLKSELVLVLDAVQNPGNLGTILRIADWFGIRHVVCSTDSADVFNPKTVQATMGALARVQVHYTDLHAFLTAYRSLDLPVYGTFLDGTDIYQHDLCPCGAILLGNEGSGVSPSVAAFATECLCIPSFPPGVPTSESLNVAVAAAVVCAEFRRRALM